MVIPQKEQRIMLKWTNTIFFNNYINQYLKHKCLQIIGKVVAITDSVVYKIWSYKKHKSRIDIKCL